MIQKILISLFFAVVLPVNSIEIFAQKRSSRSRHGAPSAVANARKEHENARQEFRKATDEYKKSLRELLVLREASEKRAEDDLTRVKPLFAEGLISKHDLEAKEEKVTEEKTKVAEVHKQLTEADVTLSQALAEADVATLLGGSRGSTSGITQRTAYFRFDGPARWGLSNAGEIQLFFDSKFHRALPISAFGQTELHNRMGFDHSNAMDVGVNPDSVEGRALVAYLESSGIPFIAFRRAVPGAATGPHIHIGKPSHRR